MPDMSLETRATERLVRLTELEANRRVQGLPSLGCARPATSQRPRGVEPSSASGTRFPEGGITTGSHTNPENHVEHARFGRSELWDVVLAAATAALLVLTASGHVSAWVGEWLR